MLGLVSIGSAQDIEMALKLVKLVSDPEAAGARLEELRAASTAANAVIREANEQGAASGKRERDAVGMLESAAQIEKEARVEAERLRGQIEKERREFERVKNAFDEGVARFDVAANEKRAALGERERVVAVAEAALKTASEAEAASIITAADRLAERARLVADTEENAAEALAEARDLKEQYEKKLSALRLLVQ